MDRDEIRNRIALPLEDLIDEGIGMLTAPRNVGELVDPVQRKLPA
jgi:hypothetical protein